MVSKMILVEWSPSQCAIHYSTQKCSMQINMSSILRGRKPDYIPIRECSSYEEANKFSDEFVAILEKKGLLNPKTI